uniref:Transcription factor Elf N-terminal domain-containing protein n=1 Tax=Oncorhynchus tshawytscha TaxID=74940 RepID=A0A8C8GLW8_ONCTS
MATSLHEGPANQLDLLIRAVEASVHYQQSGTSIYCSDKTIEAAEALLHMDSVTSLRGDRSPGIHHDIFHPYIAAQVFTMTYSIHNQVFTMTYSIHNQVFTMTYSIHNQVFTMTYSI